MGIRIDELDVALVAQAGHAIAAMLDGATEQVSVDQISDYVLALIRDGADVDFDTLAELSEGKLSRDGTQALTGDLDFAGSDLLNLKYPGLLVKAPTLITASNPSFALDPRTRLTIELIQAAGGAGGGTAGNAAGFATAGAGGTSGGFALYIRNVSGLVTKELTVTVGAPGLGVPNANGGDGGDTTVTADGYAVQAKGGIGGTSSGVARSVLGVVSVPGLVGSGGIINLPGRLGGSSVSAGDLTGSVPIAQSGIGGDSFFGTGGDAVNVRSAGALSNGGNDGRGHGSAGSGSGSVNGGGAVAGGDGTGGCVQVWELH